MGWTDGQGLEPSNEEPRNRNRKWLGYERASRWKVKEQWEISLENCAPNLQNPRAELHGAMLTVPSHRP